MQNTNNSNDIFTILWIAACGYFSAFCKEINDKTHNKESMAIFMGEIMLHGLCGTIIGLVTSHFTQELSLITASSAIGGIFGCQLLKVTVKIVIVYLAAMKNVKIDIKDINLDDEKINKKKLVSKRKSDK